MEPPDFNGQNHTMQQYIILRDIKGTCLLIEVSVPTYRSVSGQRRRKSIKIQRHTDRNTVHVECKVIPNYWCNWKFIAIISIAFRSHLWQTLPRVTTKYGDSRKSTHLEGDLNVSFH